MIRKLAFKLLRGVSLKLIRLYAVRRNTSVHGSVHIGLGTLIYATHKLTIDRGTYIGKNCTIVVNGSIGKGVLIANAVGLVGRMDHDFRAIGIPIRFAPWIGDPDYPHSGEADRLIIEDDVWIGYGAIVLSRVRIGRGAIVAAGSIVREDVEPYSIVAGNPARTVGKRFDDRSIIEHEAKVDRFWGQWQDSRVDHALP